jgi:cyanate lyase
MGDAKRDNNYITTLLAVSNVDGTTPVVLYADPTTHRLLISSSGLTEVIDEEIGTGTGGADDFTLDATAVAGSIKIYAETARLHITADWTTSDNLTIHLLGTNPGTKYYADYTEA